MHVPKAVKAAFKAHPARPRVSTPLRQLPLEMVDTAAALGAERLPPEPAALRQARLAAAAAEQEASVLAAAAERRRHGQLGRVGVARLSWPDRAHHVPGCRTILPNFKHGGRSDGWGLPALSPKSLAPAPHRMHGVPPATTIEVLHQGSKVWSHEGLGWRDSGHPLPPDALFRITRDAMFTATTPWRHKYGSSSGSSGTSGSKRKRPAAAATAPTSAASPRYTTRGGMGPAPPGATVMAAAYQDGGGVLRLLSYLESRLVYCAHMEAALDPAVGGSSLSQHPSWAAGRAALQRLRAALQQGEDLLLFGHDGWPLVPGSIDAATAWARYLDTAGTARFGHEQVLACLLALPRHQRPWCIWAAAAAAGGPERLPPAEALPAGWAPPPDVLPPPTPLPPRIAHGVQPAAAQ